MQTFNPSLFPPSRLTWIHVSDLCYLCKKNRHEYEHVLYNREGWLYCDSCKNYVTKLSNYWFRSYNELLNVFGSEKIKVIRSSGVIENDWSILSHGMYNENINDFIIPVFKINEENKHIMKEVSLKDLIKLNLNS